MNKSRNVILTLAALLSLLMIGYGALRGETDIVLNKAVNICLECIGLG